MFWVLVVFCLRCRARVAPPVDEIEDELSFQDEFLPLSRQLGVEVEVKLEVIKQLNSCDLLVHQETIQPAEESHGAC